MSERATLDLKDESLYICLRLQTGVPEYLYGLVITSQTPQPPHVYHIAQREQTADVRELEHLEAEEADRFVHDTRTVLFWHLLPMPGQSATESDDKDTADTNAKKPSVQHEKIPITSSEVDSIFRAMSPRHRDTTPDSPIPSLESNSSSEWARDAVLALHKAKIVSIGREQFSEGAWESLWAKTEAALSDYARELETSGVRLSDVIDDRGSPYKGGGRHVTS